MGLCGGGGGVFVCVRGVGVGGFSSVSHPTTH